VEGSGHNWWQSATGEYAYSEVPCAPPGDWPAVSFARELVQRLRLPDLRIRVSPNQPWREIIGIVGNERDDGLNHAAPTIAYWPMAMKRFLDERNQPRAAVLHVANEFASWELYCDEFSFILPVERAWPADRVMAAVEAGVANAVLVKPNQCGTLNLAVDAIEAARSGGYVTVVSARSGDTEDDWLADLAVGWRSGQIKVGSTTRSERTAKWNRLLQIEAEAGPTAEY
jgi:hypothetical protein